MTYDYSRAKASADRLIRRYGVGAKLLRPTTSGPAYDPTPGPPESHDCTVVMVEWSDSEALDSRILAKDKHVLLAKQNLTIEPTPSDRLVINGDSYAIVGPDQGLGVQTIAPGGVVIYYDLQCRI